MCKILVKIEEELFECLKTLQSLSWMEQMKMIICMRIRLMSPEVVEPSVGCF